MDASFEYIISSSGSYYLTGDVTTSKSGIKVEAYNVTIDLNGYQLIGPDSGTLIGIVMNNNTNVEIRNGTVRGFQHGIYEASTGGQGHRVIGVRVLSNVNNGIYLRGSGHLVKDCTVNDNGALASGYLYCIYTGDTGTVTGNTIYNNGESAVYVYCIGTGTGSTVTDNMVSNNGKFASADVFGILADKGSTVTGNTVSNNGILADGLVRGIQGGYGSTLTGNTSYRNGASASGASVYGIYAISGSTVTGNTSYDNGNGASATGVYVYGIYLEGNNLVDQNTAYNNNTGNGGTNMNACGTCTFGTNHAP